LAAQTWQYRVIRSRSRIGLGRRLFGDRPVDWSMLAGIQRAIPQRGMTSVERPVIDFFD
jgi:hypothetical protein